MSKTRNWMVLCCCLIGLAVSAHGQRKAGLWEVTSSMSMSGMPNMPAMGSHTQQVCVTQAMIDKYGGPYSNPQNAQCQMTNLSLTPTGMSADLTCSGRMSMTGTVKSTFVDANTTKTTMLMNMSMGNGQQMQMTMESTSTYKGPDCGSVQPLAMPPSQ
ncbi:MAG TPA: DUF3617 domain-containing protein [Terracidiphilus sp.]|nr:DUF3617 domain-containing protein [Terracidiphilus sp.]